MPQRPNALCRRAVEASLVPDLAACPSSLSDITPLQLVAAGEAVYKLVKEAAESGERHLFAYVDERTAVNMYLLYTAALQFSCAAAAAGVAESTRRGCHRLRATICKQLAAFLMKPWQPHENVRRVLLLSSLVLRSHVLRRLSLQLNFSAGNLKQRTSRRTVEAASEAAAEAQSMLLGLGKVDYFLQMRKAGKITNAKKRYRRLLSREISASNIFEAWAHCSLHLLSSGEMSDSEATTMLSDFVCCFVLLKDTTINVYPVSVLPSPALLFLLTSHLVRLLSLLDGGSTYGLPETAPLASVSVGGWTVHFGGKISMFDSELQSFFITSLLDAFVAWLRAGGGMSRQLESGNGSLAVNGMPHFAKAPLFDIGIRLARAAIATWHAPPHQRRLPLVPSRAEWPQVLAHAVQLLIAVQKNVCGQMMGFPNASVSRWRQLWALYVEGTNTIFRAREDNTAAGSSSKEPPNPSGDGHESPDWSSLLSLPCQFNDPSQSIRPEVLPSAPTPVVASMLELRLLPCYERNLRRTSYRTYQFEYFRTWLELSLFGSMEEVAGVITTLAKVVRQLALELDQAPPAASGLTDFRAYRIANVSRKIPYMHWGFFSHLADWVYDPVDMNHLLGGGGGGTGSSSGSSTGCTRMSASAHSVSAPKANDCPGGEDHAARNGLQPGPGEHRAPDGPSGEAQALTRRRDQLVLLWSWACVRLLPAEALALRCVATSDACRLSTSFLPDSNLVWVMCSRVMLACQLLLAAYLASRDRSECANTVVAAAAAAEAEQWRSLLLEEVDLIGVLGAVASLLATYDAWRFQEEKEMPVWESSAVFARTLQLALMVFPAELRAALLADPSSCEPHEQSGSVHEVVDRDAAGGPVAQGSPQPSPGPRRLPLTLSAVEAVLHPETGTHPDEEDWAEITAVLKLGLQLRPTCWDASQLMGKRMVRAASLLLPPAHVRQRMAPHCCANPCCVNLAGPSERSLPRRRCGGCSGRVSYCSKECQMAHWRAGHRSECAWVGAGGTEGAAAAQVAAGGAGHAAL